METDRTKLDKITADWLNRWEGDGNTTRADLHDQLLTLMTEARSESYREGFVEAVKKFRDAQETIMKLEDELSLRKADQ